MMIAHCINYLISRFNMLADTQELISNILKKNENQTVYEKIIQSPRVRKYIKNDENEEENKNIKKFSSAKEKKKIINLENSEEIFNIDKNIISKRINVIKKNNIGEETDRNNKNSEIDEQKISQGKNQMLLMNSVIGIQKIISNLILQKLIKRKNSIA